MFIVIIIIIVIQVNLMLSFIMFLEVWILYEPEGSLSVGSVYSSNQIHKDGKHYMGDGIVRHDH